MSDQTVEPTPEAVAEEQVPESVTPDATPEVIDPVAATVAAAAAGSVDANKPAMHGRGGLEAECKAVTDDFVTGAYTLPEGKTALTPQQIAVEIKRRREANGDERREPSTGAIGDNLKRWKNIGFAVITDTAPLAFVSYTPEAYTAEYVTKGDDGQDVTLVGLSAMKAKHHADGMATKAAARAATKPPKVPKAETTVNPDGAAVTPEVETTVEPEVQPEPETTVTDLGTWTGPAAATFNPDGSVAGA